MVGDTVNLASRLEGASRRSLFGESPSTTLRRLPQEPPLSEITGARRQFA
jgi:class 3 adenylate cyclase